MPGESGCQVMSPDRLFGSVAVADVCAMPTKIPFRSEWCTWRGGRPVPHSASVTENATSPHGKDIIPPRPQGRYAAAVVDGGWAVSAGMTPRSAGALTVRGLVGSDVAPEAARQAAGLAARNALAAITEALPESSRLRRCLRMTVYVACAEGFTDLSVVADGASDALAEALTGTGAEGSLPARSAIGVRSLPSGAPVEVELSASVSERA